MKKERTELNKELKVIDFYCKKCKKSMKVSYMVTGNRNYPVPVSYTHLDVYKRQTSLLKYSIAALVQRCLQPSRVSAGLSM